MLELSKLVTAKRVSLYWESMEEKPYIGEAFFPATKQLDLDFSFIKGKDGLPVALVASAFDAKVLMRDPESISLTEGKLAFFKEGFPIDEDLRRKLITLQENYAMQLVSKVFKPYVDLIRGAKATPEIMRMQLLSQGTIVINENGVNKEVNYGFDAATQMHTETDKWDSDNAKPYASLKKHLRNYRNQNKVDGKIVIMNRKAYDSLMLDKDISTAFGKTVNSMPTDQEIQSFIERKLGINIIVDEEKYIKARDKNKEEKYFYPEDRYTILPDSVLGETIYGATPEELDLMANQSSAATVQVMAPGITITTYTEPDPVNVITKVSEVVMPSCPMLDKIYIVKVFA